MSHPNTLLHALLLFLHLLTTSANTGHHIPIGHGHCTDSSSRHYMALHLIETWYLEESYDELIFPTDPAEIRAINIASSCEQKCHAVVKSPYYRGYEIMLGRGCYCLMDEAARGNHPIVEVLKGGSGGTGIVVGSEESVGFYCYGYRRDGESETKMQSRDDGTAMHQEPIEEEAAIVSSGTFKARVDPNHIPIDSNHVFVGQGICTDSQGKYYASIENKIHPDLRCDMVCGPLSHVQYYRGYEYFPKKNACACLFDFNARNDSDLARAIKGGNGGTGPVVRVGEESKTSPAYCFNYVGPKNKLELDMEPNGGGVRNAEDTGNVAHDFTSLPGAPDETNDADAVKQHISMGHGFCVDSKGRLYNGITHVQPTEDKGTSIEYDCEKVCSQHSSSPYYQGYEAIHTNHACKCLFDVLAETDKNLSPLLKTGPHARHAAGEIVGVADKNLKASECFKYVGARRAMDFSIGAKDDPIKAKESQSVPGPVPEVKSPDSLYKLVGEGICLDSNGKWFDAIEFPNTLATHCSGHCAKYGYHSNHRGFEVTDDQFCFCLFDDGTKIAGETVKDYGVGKGKIASSHLKEGVSKVWCFEYVGNHAETSASSSTETRPKDEIIATVSVNKSWPPAKQPSSNDESEPLTEPPPYTYSSVFLPHQTHYDLLRFDPLSFSGAPLGGWGRDTRNRLASLPLRLVHGFEGNWNDFGPGKGGNEDESNPIKADGTEQRDGSEMEKNLSPEAKSEQTPQRAPHFVIHDGTGQKYICRVYFEDELVVVSRMDSMFLPAVTVADNDGSPDTYDENDQTFKDAAAQFQNVEKKQPGKNTFSFKFEKGGKNKFEIQVLGGVDVNVDGGDGEINVAETIQAAVAQILNNMGLEDDAGEEQDVNAMLAQIGMAAAVGAGVDGAAEAAGIAPQRPPERWTLQEVYDALATLKDVCSQVHLGWWSYEWCHEVDVRQFHVGVTHNGGGKLQYEVQDVTMVGHFNGAMEIIYPREFHNGVERQGTTTSVTFDSNGNVIDANERVHTKEDIIVYNNKEHRNEVLRGISFNKSLSGRGPIIKQTFDHGDMCEEVGYPRQMSVELRCCTEDEILRWMKGKSADGRKMTKEDLPKAVLAGVEESKEDICHYTSQVCTPILCPESVLNAVPPTKGNLLPLKKGRGGALGAGLSDAVATALTSLFGDQNIEDIDVLIGDEEMTEAFEELANGGEMGPLQIQGFLNKFFSGNGKKGQPKKQPTQPTVQVKEGESIRELLDRTLGSRPCLRKNMGWWTYEFCHKEHVLQYHGAELLDAKSGRTVTKMETSHLLGLYKSSGSLDYPNEDEHLHVLNATSSSSELDLGRAHPKPRGGSTNQKAAGGNGAVYVQEWIHGDTCDHETVAESVIKGGNLVQGSVERSTTVRYSCGRATELLEINEDSTCHYVIDVSVPELCHHPLFKAPVIKTQVVKCLPVK